MKARTLVLVGVVGLGGAVATLAIGAAGGMPAEELTEMAAMMAAAVIATIGATALAGWALARASFRGRLVGVTLAAVGVSLVNLAVLALLMFVSSHDAAVMTVLLVYAATVGVAAALALARGPTASVARIAATAERLAEGDLDARVGTVPDGPELGSLARSLDDMAARLQEAIVAERDAEARRRDLMTAVSHDLRTPLAGLRAMVEAVEEGVVDDPESLRRYAGEMRRAVGALSGLVDDLFELSQLDAGAIAEEVAHARLAEVVDSALTAIEGQRREKGILVETRIEGLEAEPISPRVTRVLQNLLQNAIRHTPADGSVWVEARRRPEGLEVAVGDTGEGIAVVPPERVFDPFWRGDAARSSPGSGLGLALAKRIVEAIGGDLQVETEPERGSRFAVRLPVG
jgi:signal transduction histidine kinase